MSKLGVFFGMLSIVVAQNAWSADAGNGKTMFEAEIGCNICHGMDAAGSYGPNIRGVSIQQIYHAIQNFNDMAMWADDNPQYREQQVLEDIGAYLGTLPREP